MFNFPQVWLFLHPCLSHSSCPGLSLGKRVTPDRDHVAGRLHIWPLPRGSSPTAVSFPVSPLPPLCLGFRAPKSDAGRVQGLGGRPEGCASRFNHLISEVPAKNQLACLAGGPGSHYFIKAGSCWPITFLAPDHVTASWAC